MSRSEIFALITRILDVPSYTAEDLGAHRVREYRSGKPDGESVPVILVNAKHREVIAAALVLYAMESN
jgi:hypothetical protein